MAAISRFNLLHAGLVKGFLQFADDLFDLTVLPKDGNANGFLQSDDVVACVDRTVDPMLEL